MRAALYLRASTEHQRYSTSNQAEALHRYAERAGMTIVASYEDDGRSGLDLNGRPSLRQLLQDVLTPGCDFRAVLVLDVSRWGRFQDVDESAYYEFMCRRAGVNVVYCAEPYIEADHPMAAVFKTVKRAMAAEYSRELSGKVLAGHHRLVRDGFSQGGLPSVGLRRFLVGASGEPKGELARGQRKSIATDRVVLVPGPPEEVAIVRRIFRLCAEDGLGAIQIAKTLNREGAKTPWGSPWNAPHLKYLLTNEKYAGVNVFGRTTGLLKTRRRRTMPETWTRCEGAFEPVVSPDLFAQAQGALAAKRNDRSDAVMLAQLAALYAKTGDLSGALINRQTDMATLNSYKSRFGSLTKAYALVGYHRKSGAPRRPPGKPPRFEREELAMLLMASLGRNGQLSSTIIESDPLMPSVGTFVRAFGSLRKAYVAIGYQSQASPQRPAWQFPALGTNEGSV